MTRCSITCMEPGCHNRIYYTVADAAKSVGFGMKLDEVSDIEVPLYCPKHCSDYGRHSAVRRLPR